MVITQFLFFQKNLSFYRGGVPLKLNTTAVSHIPKFGDATTSLAGDAASPAGDVDAHL